MDSTKIASLEWNFDKLISAATYSVRYMAKLEQIALEESSLDEGIQGTRGKEYERRVCVKEPEIAKCSFQDLPINIQLLIFSYLDVKTLCKIARTCKHWSMISEDELLWTRLLNRDMYKWERITNITYPLIYIEAQSELTPKQIYSRCFPNAQPTRPTSILKTKSSVFDMVLYNLQNLKTFFHRQPLKVVMFGLGLESDTKTIIHKLLWDENSPFKVIGMSPGEFEGVGSGVNLQLLDQKMELNLIILYGSTTAERELNAVHNGGRVNRLLVIDDNADKQQEREIELGHSVKELCRTVDAFIYVVNSSASTQQVKSGNNELHAMMNINWTKPTAPLLVMSCSATKTTQAENCATVSELLDMTLLNRPWMVHSVCVETMEGFLDCTTWLLHKARN